MYLKKEQSVVVSHFIWVCRIEQKTPNANKWIQSWAITKTESKTKCPIGYSSEDNIKGIFHHYVHFILWTNCPWFQQTKTWSGSINFLLRNVLFIYDYSEKNVTLYETWSLRYITF